MRTSQGGYTLIELMITVAIVGIVLSMALPAYQSYSVRAQLAEGFNLTGPLQSAVSEYYYDYGEFPADNEAAGVEVPEDYAGKHVAGISIAGAVISIEFGNDANAMINGEIVTLTAVATGGSLSWRCAGGNSIPDAYLPSSC